MEQPKERKKRMEREAKEQKERRAKYVEFKLGILSEIGKTGLASVRYKRGYIKNTPGVRLGTDLTVNEALEAIDEAIDHYLSKQDNIN
jgi:hypothetical protein